MIQEIKGNLLHIQTGYICHQTNCVGAMGAGVAKQIKNQLLTKEQYNSYRELCKKYGKDCMGKNQIIVLSEEPYRAIVNMFAEYIPTGFKQDTDYDALYKCMDVVEKTARMTGRTVAIPGRVGCGLAGGDWQYVKKNIIWPIFENSPVQLTIVYLGEIE